MTLKQQVASLARRVKTLEAQNSYLFQWHLDDLMKQKRRFPKTRKREPKWITRRLYS